MQQMTIAELHALLNEVDQAAPRDWKEIAGRAMEYLIGRGEDFTADDLPAAGSLRTPAGSPIPSGTHRIAACLGLGGHRERRQPNGRSRGAAGARE